MAEPKAVAHNAFAALGAFDDPAPSKSKRRHRRPRRRSTVDMTLPLPVIPDDFVWAEAKDDGEDDPFYAAVSDVLASLMAVEEPVDSSSDEEDRRRRTSSVDASGASRGGPPNAL